MGSTSWPTKKQLITAHASWQQRQSQDMIWYNTPFRTYPVLQCLKFHISIGAMHKYPARAKPVTYLDNNRQSKNDSAWVIRKPKSRKKTCDLGRKRQFWIKYHDMFVTPGCYSFYSICMLYWVRGFFRKFEKSVKRPNLIEFNKVGQKIKIKWFVMHASSWTSHLLYIKLILWKE